jgi:hypothetical protein
MKIIPQDNDLRPIIEPISVVMKKKSQKGYGFIKNKYTYECGSDCPNSCPYGIGCA